MPPIRVMYFRRFPIPGRSFSIEHSFEAMWEHLPADISWGVVTARHESRFGWRLLINTMQATASRETINHITGDIHYVALGLPSRGSVLTIHDCRPLFVSNPVKRAILKYLWYSAPTRRVAAITAVSEFTKRELVQLAGCDPRRVHVVPTCVSNDFRPGRPPQGREHPRLLIIGTQPNKNIPRALRALDGIPCHLRVIGKLSDDLKSQLERSGVKYSHASNLSRADLVREYLDADVILFASTYEGFGMPIIEANATGRPVITSNVASMPWVAARAACLVDPLDVDSIRAGIRRVLESADYRAELIARGFDNAVRFRPRTVAAQYADIYRALA